MPIESSYYNYFTKLFVGLSLMMIFSYPAYTQKERNIWYFGEYAGVSFNNPANVPVALTNGALFSEEGCASICDVNGKILFYTDGVSVWNKNHLVMPNGSNLMGVNQSTQSSLIIKKPNSSSKYYIITTDFGFVTNGCTFSEIDLTQNSGLGDVTSIKNVPIFTPTTEKLTAVKHGNGTDYWIIGHEWNSDVFRVYLLSATGIDQKPVLSIVGRSQTGNTFNKKGYLKANKLGNKLALAINGDATVELFDFDVFTGKVQNGITLRSSLFQNVYGLEFSPNSSKLYVSRFEPTSAIYQFDLKYDNAIQILNSSILITENRNERSIGALLLAPDSKIYVARSDQYFLGCINQPDSIGKACDYKDSALYLSGRKSKLGLPNEYSDNNLKVKIKANSPVCIGDTLELVCDEIFSAGYIWDGPNGYFSDLNKPKIRIDSIQQSGFYYVVMKVGNNIIKDSLYIKVFESPVFDLKSSGPPTICLGDTLELYVESANNDISYKWMNNQVDKSIKVFKEGIYSVTGSLKNGCSITKKIEVKNYKFDTKIKPLGPLEFCVGDSVILSAYPMDPKNKIKWSTGESTTEIIVKNSKLITLEIENEAGCKGFDSAYVVVYENLNVEIIPDKSPPYCEGDTILLSTNYNAGKIRYKWSDNSVSPFIKVIKSGIYNVILSYTNGCADSGSINIQVLNKPDIKISADNLTFCEGDFCTLKAESNYSGNLKYFWNTSDTTNSIKVVKPGRYQVTIENESGCSNSANLDINVLPVPGTQIQPDGPTNLCEGELLKLNAFPNQNSFKYKWSTGSISNNILVNKSGIYTLSIENEFGCIDSASIEVKVNPQPKVEITTNNLTTICKGSSIILYTKDKYQSYHWNNGESKDSIQVTDAGNFFVTVIDSNGCQGVSNTLNITLANIETQISNIEQMNFGNQCLGNIITRQIELKNTSNRPILIDSVYFSKGEGFLINTVPSYPALINSNNSILAQVTFLPKKLKDYNETINFRIISPCLITSTAPVAGAGIARSEFKVADTVIPVGYKYCIPIWGKLTCGDSIYENLKIRGIIRIDASMFYPDSIQNITILNNTVIDGERIIEFACDTRTLTKENKVLFTICGTVLYGKFEWVTIQLDEINWGNTKVTSISQSGEMEVYGVCGFEIGHITLTGETTMEIVSDSKSNEMYAKINTTEKGQFSLQIYSYDGRQIDSQIFSNTQNKNEFSIKLTKSIKSSGLYFTKLVTPGTIKSHKFIINK